MTPAPKHKNKKEHQPLCHQMYEKTKMIMTHEGYYSKKASDCLRM